LHCSPKRNSAVLDAVTGTNSGICFLNRRAAAMGGAERVESPASLSRGRLDATPSG
jgi:hypothetical protein